MSKDNIFRRGREAIAKSGGDIFVSIGAGESIEIAPLVGLDDLISIDQHAFWIPSGNSPIFPCLSSSDCPGCQLGNAPSYKAFLPVLLKDQGSRIYAFGIGVCRDLVGLEETFDDGTLKSHIIKISRRGSGLETRYSVIGTARTVDISGHEPLDIVENLGSIDRDDIIAQLMRVKLWKPETIPDAEGFSKESVESTVDEGDEWEDI